MPYRSLIGQVCAALHWTPADFWRSTPHEFMAIVEAQEAMNGNAR
jgi:hypothetical protein